MDLRKSSVAFYILAGLFGGGAVVEVEIGIKQVGLAVARLDQRPLEGAHRLVMLLDLAECNAMVIRGAARPAESACAPPPELRPRPKSPSV